LTFSNRNDQLYNKLIGRAEAIESELGARDGAFASRLGVRPSIEAGVLMACLIHRIRP
jgi:hypothetical protein